MTIKAGDMAWECREVFQVQPGIVQFLGDTHEGILATNVIPDSPALPAVAQWLVDWPGMVDHLPGIIAEWQDNTNRFSPGYFNIMDGMYALLNALTVEEDNEDY